MCSINQSINQNVIICVQAKMFCPLHIALNWRSIIHFQRGFITKSDQIWLSRARIEQSINTRPSDYTTCYFFLRTKRDFIVTKILGDDVIFSVDLCFSQKIDFMLLVLLTENVQTADMMSGMKGKIAISLSTKLTRIFVKRVGNV